MKSKLTISRPSFGDGKEAIAIHIKDELSGKTIVEVHVGYSDFAEALTGLGAVPSEVERLLDSGDLEKVGKKKIVETVYCKRDYRKDVQKDIVQHDFLTRFSNKWELLSDGPSTQQHGEEHKYTIVKWETVT